jgi:hypothetical protein
LTTSLPLKDLFLEIHSGMGDFKKSILKLSTNSLESDSTTQTELRKGPAERQLEEIRELLILVRKHPDPSSINQLGKFLFEFLPNSISNFIEQEYNLAKENQQLLRLKIVTKELGLVDIPWELLQINDEFLSLYSNVSILRYIPAPVFSPPLLIQYPLRILFVLTNPKDERLLLSDQELQAIKGGLDGDNRFETDVLWEPTLTAFKDKLLERQYHVVHYIGHGGLGRGEGNLILHNYEDKTYWLNTNELAAILPPSVRLLCLSTCFTTQNYQIQAFNRLGQTRERFDLPSMVVNQFPLSREGVNIFWRTFYMDLITTGALEPAVRNARTFLAKQSSSSSVDWASFVLHLRSPNDNLFSITQFLPTTRGIAESPLFSEKTQQVKALEVKIDSLTTILNDLKSQVSAYDEPSEGLKKVIEGTEKHHKDLLGEYVNLKRSFNSQNRSDD